MDQTKFNGDVIKSAEGQVDDETGVADFRFIGGKFIYMRNFEKFRLDR